MKQYNQRSALGMIYDTAKYAACAALIAVAGCGKKQMPTSAHAEFIMKHGIHAGYENGAEKKAMIVKIESGNKAADIYAAASAREVTLSRDLVEKREIGEGKMEVTEFHTKLRDDLSTPGYDSGSVSKTVYVETEREIMSPEIKYTANKTVQLTGRNLENAAAEIIKDLEEKIKSDAAKKQAEEDDIISGAGIPLGE